MYSIAQKAHRSDTPVNFALNISGNGVLQSIRKTVKNIRDFKNIQYRRDKNIEMLPNSLLMNAEKSENRVTLVLLDDDKTPLEYVFQVLYFSLNLSRKDALLSVVEAHENGVSIIGNFSETSANNIIEVIHKNAKSNGYPLKLEIKMFNNALQSTP